jgi:ubiquinone/menaquinone biosynthesis C-methylase UbiE
MDTKEFYSKAWASGEETNSRTAIHWANFLIENLPKAATILDLGCGNGIVVSALREAGFEAWGVDVTLDALKSPYRKFDGSKLPEPCSKDFFRESPLWDIDYQDDYFEYAVSCDVLEHIAEDRLPEVFSEINRVASNNLHVVACFAHKNFHETVKPISWWRQFPGTFYDRKEFLNDLHRGRRAEPQGV